ncbi:MAG TPA: tetratricopeptide repeat protein [Anaeromyxobacteraceae bacterium]|nr:tetratricopeptide repeat protein [Anaeromyxobacteraceae bacterium]
MPLKDIEVLLALVERRGRIVPKEEILAAVWPDVIVEEGNLARHVSSLRRALADGEDGERWIETHPKRGYRFVGAVAEVPAAPRRQEPGAPATGPEAGPAEGPGEGRPRRSRWPRGRPALVLGGLSLAAVAWLGSRVAWRGPRPAGPIASLAVLPLANLTGDAQQEYLADAVTEGLVANLGRIRALRVISRTSAMQYKGTQKTVPQIASELRVEGVVEGSVMRAGDRFRVTAQLIDARTDGHLWAETFECDAREVLDLQAAIARAIADRLRVEVRPEERSALAVAPPVQPEAWRAYARGRHFWNQRTSEGIAESIRHFERAVALDPGYARAHAGLSDAYALAAEYRVLPPATSFPRARAAALRALEIDPLLGEAHASLGAILQAEWDWAGAERAYRRALELNPGYASAHQWYGELLTLLGRHEEAIARAARARDLDPASRIANAVLGVTWYYAGRYGEALEQLRATLALDPQFAVAHEMLGRACDATALHGEALEAFRRAVQLSGRSPEYLAALARSLALGGDAPGARALLAELRQAARTRYVSPVEFAMVHAALGERDRAFEWLERAYQERSTWLPWLGVGPGLAELRGDPRFRDLMRRLGLGG